MNNMRNSLCLLICCLFYNITCAQQQLNYYDTIPVGGIKQVIAVNGKPEGPVLLFLHGGPGESRIPQMEKVSGLLREKFCVVMWDQRETGLTLKLNTSPVPVTFALTNQDTYELVTILRKKFHQDKIYIMGESWGTMLGFQLAAVHPECVKALMVVCPVVNQPLSERMALDSLKIWAGLNNNKQALSELNTVSIPFRTSDDLFYERKWMNTLSGRPFPDKDTSWIKDYLKVWCDTWLKPWNEAIENYQVTAITKFKCPVYFFLGGKDFQTNAAISKAYFNQLSAPVKKMYWFENDGHSLMLTGADNVQKIVLSEILPVANRK
jgi:pimeloyl-ACP methyl ester carboxylesterase